MARHLRFAPEHLTDEWIRRITFDNSMSHSHTVIEPAERLTILFGPNN